MNEPQEPESDKDTYTEDDYSHVTYDDVGLPEYDDDYYGYYDPADDIDLYDDGVQQ